MTTRLLVSVRSVAEADAAIAGGCEVVDVKEPSRGPLGMADVEVIAEVAGLAAAAGRQASAAMGEVVDWEKSDARPPRLPAGLDYAKLGLSQLAADPLWSRRWCRVRESLGKSVAWIAVAYADAAACGAPVVEEVVAAAVETGCRGVLIDTWDKSSGDLLEHLDQPRLAAIRASTAGAGLLLALAGRVCVSRLPGVLQARPDIVAIRTAACRGGDRQAEIDGGAVAEFADRLSQASLAAAASLPAG